MTKAAKGINQKGPMRRQSKLLYPNVWETNAIFMRILGETDESARRALRRSHARGEEREKRILLE